MRILADENVPRAIVVRLRAEGHDVLYAAESRPRVPDEDLPTEAEPRGYVIVTEDKDFGELVFRDRRNSHGVILLRMEDLPASARLARLPAAWAAIEANQPGNFIVVSQTKLRARPLTIP